MALTVRFIEEKAQRDAVRVPETSFPVLRQSLSALLDVGFVLSNLLAKCCLDKLRAATTASPPDSEALAAAVAFFRLPSALESPLRKYRRRERADLDLVGVYEAEVSARYQSGAAISAQLTAMGNAGK